MNDKLMLDQITLAIEQAVSEFLEVAHLESGDILVVGCSSSEVQKQRIGSASSYEVGKCIYEMPKRRGYGRTSAYRVLL